MLDNTSDYYVLHHLIVWKAIKEQCKNNNTDTFTEQKRAQDMVALLTQAGQINIMLQLHKLPKELPGLKYINII